MSFNLWTDGLRVADRFARSLNLHYINGDPLSGVVDGTNTLFYSTYSPILSSGSIEVRNNIGAVVSSGSYTLDHEPGAFRFTTAPSFQPRATYTVSRYPDRVIRSALVAGFDEMELRFPRGFTLSEVTGSSSVVPITEDSPAAYVVTSSGSDPVINATGPLGTIYWGDSRQQVGLYGKCVQYAWLLIQLGEHAMSDFIWTEAQGLRVDKSGIPKNIELAKRNVKEDLDRAIQAAQIEVFGAALFGGAFAPPLTREFLSHRFWERASKDQGWRDSTPYVGYVW